MTIEEARDLIVREGLPPADLADDSVYVMLRMGDDPGPERMRGLLGAMGAVFLALRDHREIDRRLAAALWILGETATSHIASWAFEAGTSSWRKGFQDEVAQLQTVIQSIFLDEWGGTRLLKPEEFVVRWNDLASEDLPASQLQLVRADVDAVAGLSATEAERDFLVEAGLPRAAAPGMSFEEVGNGLRRITELYDLGDDAPEFARYRMIGTDGTGNPICIDDDEAGRVVLLDEESGLRNVRFVNSSIPQLAECLWLYALANNEAIRIVEEDLTDEADEQAIKHAFTQSVMARFTNVDHLACREGCLWWPEVNTLWDNVTDVDGEEYDEAEPAAGESEEPDASDKYGKAWWRFGK
jgi:hypothetical protein